MMCIKHWLVTIAIQKLVQYPVRLLCAKVNRIIQLYMYLEYVYLTVCVFAKTPVRSCTWSDR